jgi:hypothetical protein
MNTVEDPQARVDAALSPRWMHQRYHVRIGGHDHDSLSLDWSFNADAFDRPRTRELGKHVIFTDRHHWPTTDLVVAYRCQWQVEAAFRQTGDPDHAAF